MTMNGPKSEPDPSNYDNQSDILSKIRNEEAMTASDRAIMCRQIERDLSVEDHLELAKILIKNEEHHKVSCNNSFSMFSLNNLTNKTLWMFKYYINICLSGPREKDRFASLYRDVISNRQEFEKDVDRQKENAPHVKVGQIPDYQSLVDEAMQPQSDRMDNEQIKLENMIKMHDDEHFPTPNLN